MSPVAKRRELGAGVLGCGDDRGLSPTVREGSKNVANGALPYGRASAPLRAAW